MDEPFARAFGLSPAMGREGLSLEKVVATVHPDDQAGLAAAIDEAMARGGAYAANAAVGAGHLDTGMAVLTKPFNILELERRVGEMLAA